MIHEVGNIELCELLETEPKTQCKVCLSHWDIDIVYCTCGHFLRKQRGEISNSSSIRWTLLSIPEYVIKKGRPHGHRYGKKAGRQGILFGKPVEEENARNSFSKESMTDSYEMKHSVIEWLKMVETKMFVDNGMLLQMKIIPTIWPHKNITITRVFGGFIQNKTGSNTCASEAQTWLQTSTVYLAAIETGRRRSSTKSTMGTKFFFMVELARFMVDPVIPMKVTMEMNQVLTEQGDLLYKYLELFFREWFSWVQLLCYRWIVHSWRRSTVTDGWCKYNTSNDVFSRCNSVHKMATGKKWRSTHTAWQQVKIGTKMKLGPKVEN